MGHAHLQGYHTQKATNVDQGLLNQTINAAAATKKSKFDFNVRKCSIAYVVIMLMMLGMEPLQLQIADLANVQNASSDGQNDVTNLGSFLSYIESQVKGYGMSSSGDGGVFLRISGIQGIMLLNSQNLRLNLVSSLKEILPTAHFLNSNSIFQG